jgi:hypothetical protein
MVWDNDLATLLMTEKGDQLPANIKDNLQIPRRIAFLGGTHQYPHK